MKRDRLLHPGDAWFRWGEEHASELPLPISRMWREQNVAMLQFNGAHPNLLFGASALSIVTSVRWLGNFAGELQDIDVNPKRDRDGFWCCNLCDPSEQKRFETMNELWADHLFEPWAEHVRQLFRCDIWVALGGSEDSYWVEAMPLRHLKLDDSNRQCAFRTCVEPQKLNPLCDQMIPVRKCLGGGVVLGPSVTGLGRRA